MLSEYSHYCGYVAILMLDAWPESDLFAKERLARSSRKHRSARHFDYRTGLARGKALDQNYSQHVNQ